MLRIRLSALVVLASLVVPSGGCGSFAPTAEDHAEKRAPAATDLPERAPDSDPPDAPATGDPAVDPSVALDAADAAALDAFVADRMAIGNVPGVTLSVVRRGKLAYAHAYGVADKEAKTPMATSSIIEVASISKTVTGIALMQLEAAGKVKLDDDVSTYLAKPLRNPRRSNEAITLRMLLTHTSSILSNEDALDGLYREGSDATISLAELTEQYFYPGGRLFRDGNFADAKPGTTNEYCNVCIALVGHVIERVSGASFVAYTKDRIFTPLGMTSTTWLLSDTDKTRLASPYGLDSSGRQLKVPHIGLPDLPAGSLKTTASDFALFLAAIGSGGASAKARILGETSLAEMLRVQLPFVAPGQGLAFIQWERNGALVWGHNGALEGIASTMSFAPGTGNGAAVFSNSDWLDAPEAQQPLVQIEAKALELASTK